MNIAVQAADLDGERIDGTRVYLWQLLNWFGSLAPMDTFSLYHRTTFNNQLTPPNFPNYQVHSIPQPLFWTQTRLALALRNHRPDALWMPVQSVPVFRSKKIKTTVTIHDLAFRYFPESFPWKDRYKLFALATLAIRNADRLIAVSEHTKKDILHFYPDIEAEKITVVHHGYDKEMFEKESDVSETRALLEKYKLQENRYLLYVGALQPRKNLVTLIHAFEMLKKKAGFEDIKLVLAGERAWLWESIDSAREKSRYRDDIIITGKLPFAHIKIFYKKANAFIYPSLYEGFGLPLLEGFSAGIPVISARNSSLTEVGGEAPLYFDPLSKKELANTLEDVVTNEKLREQCIAEGKKRLELFSWEKCAKETLTVIRGE